MEKKKHATQKECDCNKNPTKYYQAAAIKNGSVQ